MKNFIVLVMLFCIFGQTVLKAKNLTITKDKPIGFVENKGQFRDQHGDLHPSVLYMADFEGLKVQLNKAGFSYETYQIKPKWKKNTSNSSKIIPINNLNDTTYSWLDSKESDYNKMYHFHRVDVKLRGSNSRVKIQPDGKEIEIDKWLIGNENLKSVDVKKYERIRYSEVYPNIDMVCYASNVNEGFKYDFILHPGANPSSIELCYSDAESINLTPDGDLNVTVRFGIITEEIPLCFSEDEFGNRKIIDGIQYEINRNVIKFKGAINLSDKLVIDPAVNICWGSYYGGNGFDEGIALKTDSLGFVYMCGNSSSIENIASSGNDQDSLLLTMDGFLAKFSKSGERIWGSYISEYSAFDMDISKNIVVLTDGKIIRFDLDGNVLWQRNSTEGNNTICFDEDENIITAGDNTVLKSSNEQLQSKVGIISKYNSNGSLQWTRSFGHSNTTITDIDCDALGNIYLAGNTSDTINISTPDSFQPYYGGGNSKCWVGFFFKGTLLGFSSVNDGFFAKLTPDGQYVYGSYYGGTRYDEISGISVSPNGDFALIGHTNSLNGISTPGSLQEKLSPQASYAFKLITINASVVCDNPDSWVFQDTCVVGSYRPKPYDNRVQCTDAFVAMFNSDGNRRWGSYYGDSYSEHNSKIFLNSAENLLYIGGITTGGITPENNLSTHNSYKEKRGFGNSVFLGCLDLYGNRRWGTYFDEITTPEWNDWGDIMLNDLIVDWDDQSLVYITGTTVNNSGISTKGSHQPIKSEGTDGFLVKFADADIESFDLPNHQSVCMGDSTEIVINVTTEPIRKSNYTWYHNNILIPLEIDSTLTIHGDIEATGWYKYIISQGSYSKIDSINVSLRNGIAFTRSEVMIENHRKSAARIGDFNDDGLMDFSILGSKNIEGTEKEHLVYKSHENNYSIEVMPTPLQKGELILFDINNDNKLDIVGFGDISSYENIGITKFYLNTENGFVISQTHENQYSPASADFSDYDHDGDYDLIVTGWKSSIYWADTKIIKNEKGLFSTSSFEFPPIYSGQAKFADFNNDTHVDILIAGNLDGSFDDRKHTKVYANSNGNYSLLQSFTPVLGRTCQGSYNASAVWGDLDADGDLDFVVSGATNWCEPFEPKIFVYFNNNNVFELYESINCSWEYRTILGDMDNDGYLDIINGKNVYLYKNGFYIQTPTTYSIAHTGLIGDAQFISDDINPVCGDMDNDGDLDILTASGLYNNDICNLPNTPPTCVDRLVSVFSGDTIAFSWDRATDLQTPQMGLTYNLRVGRTSKGNDILPSMSDDSGMRKVVGMGNVYQNTTWWINGLEPGTYYWSVQAIDNSFAGGPFAAEASFTICDLPVEAAVITGKATVCQGQNAVSYTVPTIANATSYVWTLPSGATGASTTNSITVDFGTNAVSGDITVKGTNACGDGTASTLAIIINPTPTAPTVGTITQPTCSVATGSVVLNGLPTGNWTINPGAITGSTTSKTISGLAAGTYNYTVTNASGCISNASANVVINAQPTTPTAPTIILNGNILQSNAVSGNQWYFENVIINGASNQNYTATTTGNYYVIVTLLGCSSEPSNNIYVAFTGLDVYVNNKLVKVYPNPTSKELIIEIEGNTEKINFEILNAIGQVIYRSDLVEKTEVNTSKFMPGFYILKLENGGAFERIKIVKE